MSSIGERLRKAREKADLTQAEVARRIGVTRSVIARYESGRNDPPSENIAKLAEIYGVSTEKKEVAVLTPEQASALLKAAEGRTIYPVILLALTTGMRRGEILGLRWQDVDLERGVVYVRQALRVVRGEDGYRLEFGPPLKGKSQRRIALPPGAAELLKRWQVLQKEMHKRAGKLFKDRGLVCCRCDGSPLDPREITKRVAYFIRKQGFECTLHGLRHTHASLLIDRDVHAKKISERLGHVWYGDSPGARLRQTRVAKGMTIRDLAAATGLTPATISSLEAGRTTASLPNLRKLAQVLGVPIAYLGCFETLPENTLGQRITKARLYHGLTKEEFAQIIGVDVKTLRHWEQGEHVPLPRYFNVLNQYLKVLEE